MTASEAAMQARRPPAAPAALLVGLAAAAVAGSAALAWLLWPAGQPRETLVSVVAGLAVLQVLTLFGAALLLGRRARRDVAAAEQRSRAAQEASERLLEGMRAANEELARAKAKADSASIAKSLFLANMSHELKTPLNAIIGFSTLIRDQQMGPIANEHYIEYASDIHDSGNRLLQVIADILEMANLDSGQVQLSESEIDVERLLAGVAQLARPQAEKAELRLDVESEPGLPPLIADDRAIRVILTNLLSNAVKFSKPGGHVLLGARRSPTGGLIFSVTDSGIGMDEAAIPKLITPFTQASETLARSFEGTGLGLPIVNGLTRLHDGTLDIRSRLGVGTTVRVELPPWRLRGGVAEGDATLFDMRLDPTVDFDQRLVLVHGGGAVSVFPGSGSFLLGRNRPKPNEVRCDIVVEDLRVSRPHALVRWEEGAFHIVDQSQRGTWVRTPDGQETVLKRDMSVPLPPQGEISLGVAPSENDAANLIRFEVEAGGKMPAPSHAPPTLRGPDPDTLRRRAESP